MQYSVKHLISERQYYIIMRKRPECLGRLVFLIFIFLFYQTKNILTPNISIVRATIFISDLNNESKSKKHSIYTTHQGTKFKNSKTSCIPACIVWEGCYMCSALMFQSCILQWRGPVASDRDIVGGYDLISERQYYFIIYNCIHMHRDKITLKTML